MKYEVLDSHLIATIANKPDVVFKRGEFVTEKDLADAGFDVEFLLKNKSVEPLKGSFDAGEVESGEPATGEVEKVSRAPRKAAAKE